MATVTMKIGGDNRAEVRNQKQVFARIRVLDEENETADALIEDFSSSGLALLTPRPLPAGTCVTVELCGQCAALGEIVDWNWDYNRDLARLGLRFIRKSTNWPLV